MVTETNRAAFRDGKSEQSVQICQPLQGILGLSDKDRNGYHTPLPRRYRGKDILWWLDAMGIFDETVDQVFDIEVSRRQPSLQLVGRPDHGSLDLALLQERGVRLVGRVVAAEGQKVFFADDLVAYTAGADLKVGDAAYTSGILSRPRHQRCAARCRASRAGRRARLGKRVRRLPEHPRRAVLWLLGATDNIASFSWDLPTVKQRHLFISEEMGREVAALVELGELRRQGEWLQRSVGGRTCGSLASGASPAGEPSAHPPPWG